MRARATALVMLLGGQVACSVPRVAPLTGIPSSLSLPQTPLPPGHQTIVFRWTFSDRLFGARGDGAARVAPPDSARLDFFADGGLGGGYAIVLGDSIYTPGGDQARRYLPPVPLLWAAFGTLRLVGLDTLLRVDGDTLRADILSDTLSPASRTTFWRVAFVGRVLTRVERVDGGRLVEFVERVDSAQVRYRHNAARRSLGLTIQNVTKGVAFDPTIWQH